MARLIWDAVGERYYEAGVDRGVLYVDDAGFSWNGLVAVEETPSGGEARSFYIDGVKYLNLSAKEEFEATISAFYSPFEFDQCEGVTPLASGLNVGQQRRKSFGLSYRTKLGNDTTGTDHGYKIHVIYNALVAPTTRSYASIDDNPEAPLLVWPITTKPVAISGMSHSSHIVIDSTKVSRLGLQAVEKALYGTDSSLPTLPTPEEIANLLATADEFKVTDLGAGLFMISGPVENVIEASPGLYQITHATAVVLTSDGATISSA